MPRQLHPVFTRARPVRARAWLGAALLVVLVAALCGAATLALPQAARAEAAPGAFVWSAPWLFGTTDFSSVVDLVKARRGLSTRPATRATVRRAAPRSSPVCVPPTARRSGGRPAPASTSRPRPATPAATSCWRAPRPATSSSSNTGPNGSVAWSRTWGGASTLETATDVALASDGSVYVSGMRRTGATGRDAVVICLSPGGVVRWRHLTATKGDDIAEAVTTDAAGNAYVTGSREGGASDSVWTTYKLSPRGKRLWWRNVTFISSNTFGSGRWLRVRGDALYVVAQRGTTTSRFAAMKLSLGGKERWLKGSYVLPAPAQFADATVDARGRLYIVGHLQPTGTPGVTAQGELLVCRADGTIAWHDEFEDPLGVFDTGFSGVVVDAAQRAYCSGYMATAAGNVDLAAVVVRYQADAGIETIWRWDGGVGGVNGFGPLLRDPVLIAGAQVTTAAGSQAMVQRLKP